MAYCNKLAIVTSRLCDVKKYEIMPMTHAATAMNIMGRKMNSE